jgi:hypothetical protein
MATAARSTAGRRKSLCVDDMVQNSFKIDADGAGGAEGES